MPGRRQEFFSPLDLLPPSAVPLGRLVSNIQRPCDSFVDPTYDATLLDQAIIRQKISSHTHVTTSGSHRAAAFAFSRVFSVSSGSKGTLKVSFELLEIETVQLGNCEAFFRQALAQEAVKEWLAGKSKYSHPAYMIAGFATANTLRVLNGQTKLGQHRGALVPTSALISIGSANLASEIATQFGGQVSSVNGELEKMEIREKTVWAVLYRKIKFRFVKRTHQMTQGKTQWTVMLGTRGEADGEGVFLVDGELETDDVGVHQDLDLDGIRYENFEDGDGNTYLVRIVGKEKEKKGAEQEEEEEEEEEEEDGEDSDQGWEKY
ncbi:hypothetical protein BDZ91DRAFT_786743 [Kalaharituber pfeilii]|nr:hypothetical protein BDZ91DRAFT_786743 [Kalaharituber pfeilii]